MRNEKTITLEPRELKNIKKALKTGTLSLRVDKVSKSGMSRIITIAYPKKNSYTKQIEVLEVSQEVYKLAGCDKNHRISGCGMDMLFQAWYNIARSILPKTDYRKLPNYNYLP